MTKVLRTCAVCSAPFHARQADVARGWAKCCSKVCAAKRRERVNTPSAAQLRQRRRWADGHGPRPDLRTRTRLPPGYVGSWTDEYGQGCFNDAHLFSNEEHDCNKD